MSDFDLNALIDRALAGKEPDPHVIARRLLPKVPRDERDALLASLLVERVTLRMRMGRSAWLATDLAQGHSESDALSRPALGDLAADRSRSDAQRTHVGGTSRWQKHFPKMRDRYKVSAGWKFKTDLTADECDEIAADYRRRSEQNAALEAHFRQLASSVRAAGVATVGELQTVGERAA